MVLAAPECPFLPDDPVSEVDQLKLSWAGDGTSACLIDTGLWTACKESCEAMLRRFSPEDWWCAAYFEKGEDEDFDFTSIMDAPVTAWYHVEESRATTDTVASFKSARKVWRALTVYPESDLFILQPVSIDWKSS
jgi:hypothetical protein